MQRFSTSYQEIKINNKFKNCKPKKKKIEINKVNKMLIRLIRKKQKTQLLISRMRDPDIGSTDIEKIIRKLTLGQ